ncbi:hypothetical protein L218DRAFT_160185 [Marasmius fiardii PR-910]|nr:hypothetical protein L218DRAFT_160185 [Marasmius fiardii PR-910]
MLFSRYLRFLVLLIVILCLIETTISAPAAKKPKAPKKPTTKAPAKVPAKAPAKAPPKAPVKAPPKPPAKATTKAAAKAKTTKAAAKATTTKAAAKATKTKAAAKATTTKAAAKAPTTKAASAKAPSKATTKAASAKAVTTKAAAKVSTKAPAKASTTKVPAKVSTKASASAKPPPPTKSAASPPCKRTGEAGQSCPVNPPPAADDVCSKKTSCTGCVGEKKKKCAFDFDKGVCIDATQAPNSPLIAKQKNQCTTLQNQKNAADKAAADKAAADAAADEAFTKAAQSAFGKLQNHVFGKTPGQSPTSGRHVASALANEQVIKDNYTRSSNANTGLSQFTKNSGADAALPAKKTTWDDDTGKYSQSEVKSMCQQAIKLVMKHQNSAKLVRAGPPISVSVPSPRGMNLCITVQGDTSVFPKNTGATTKATGELC